MRLSRVWIEGYRSLANLDWKIGEFSVLVGPNNSGKSNIVDALDFMSRAYSVGLPMAFDEKGGFENVAFRAANEPARVLTFASEVVLPEFELRGFPPFPGGVDRLLSNDRSNKLYLTPCTILHRFSILGTGTPLINDFYVDEEEVTVRSDIESESTMIRVKRKRNDISGIEISESGKDLLFPFAFKSEDDPVSYLRMGLDSTNLMLSSLYPTLPSLYRAFFQRARTFLFSPLACRNSASPAPVSPLDVHGSNLAAVVYHLREGQDYVWLRILETMSMIVRELVDIYVIQTEDRRWALRFVQEDGQVWSANEVSDGTIRALALFVSLFDPATRLIALEEPENSLHPWILDVFVDICKEVSKPPSNKQVILTTHSPILIDRLTPDDVSVTWKANGHTALKPIRELDPDLEASWSAGAFTLFDYVNSGALRETVRNS